MNHIVEVKHIQNATKAGKVRKISKNEYVDIETGEVKECEISEFKNDIRSLKRTMKNMRELINMNFIGSKNEKFVTLTYAENMTDTERLYTDFEKFVKKLRYKYGNVDYVSAVEPQGRGAWHCHVLLKFNDYDEIFIDNNKVIAKLWGHGYTFTEGLEQVDNVGAYLSAYLSNLPEETGNLDKHNKKYIKGARLSMYPSGMNIYRASKGIKKPTVQTMTYSELKKIVNNKNADYQSRVLIVDEGRTVNCILSEQYNLNRV
jgi:hypothetical protein